MKRLLLLTASAALCGAAYGQAPSITANDMPVSGDTLRSSFVVPVGANLNLSNTGTNIAWDYSSLVPIRQDVDAYKTASQVNITYALTISPNAYGYLVADTFDLSGMGGGAPVTVTDVYTFFSKKTSPSRFVAEAFAAEISGFPTPANYDNEDEWYFFPLDYGDFDSSIFKLDVSFFGAANLKIDGTRKTFVDGWGTIKTPHFTTAVPCLRVRSEVDETDTVSYMGTDFGFPRRTVEYKWLTPGEHYPALWVVTDETTGTPATTQVRFRDHYRHNLVSVGQVTAKMQMLEAYPVPAKDEVTISVPDSWTQLSVVVFSSEGKVAMQAASARLNIASLAGGTYFARVISGEHTGYVRFVK